MIPADAESAFERIRTGKNEGQALELDWETVYRSIWPILVARLSKRGMSSFAADAVQSALLSILGSPPLISRFYTIYHFLAYASRVAKNRAIDAIRQALRHASLDEIQNVTDPKNPHKDLMPFIPKQFSKEEIDLLRMFYVEGWTYNEIAKKCNSTERAIKTRMFMLQKGLRTIFEKKASSDGESPSSYV